MDDLISTEDVARFLGVTRPTVIKYIQDERLTAMRTGKAYKIAKNDLVIFARDLGVSENRLAELDLFLKKRNKKTGFLDSDNLRVPLVGHPQRLPLRPDVEVLYFLAVRLQASSNEIILRVKAPKFFIGRHSLASLSIQDPYVSTLHATLLHQDDYVEVLDQSTNGTAVPDGMLRNGETLAVGDGDQFRVGTTILTLISAERVDLYLGSDLSAEAFHGA